MLGAIIASKTARMVTWCVCPVVGAGTLTMSVPKVRDAVHKATAPRQYALPKTRERPDVIPAKATPLGLASAPCPSIASPLVDHGFMESVEDPFTSLPPRVTPLGGTGPKAFQRKTPESVGGSSTGSSSGGFPSSTSSGGDPGTSTSTSTGGIASSGDPSSSTSTGGLASSGGIPSSSGGSGIVPEPHAWLQLLVGFALIGGSLRLVRRKPTEDEQLVLDRVDELK